VKRITPYLTALLLLIGLNLLSGCDTQDLFMDEEDKQPRMEVLAYAVAAGGCAGGSMVAPPVCTYCIYDEKGNICDGPKTVLRFELYVESYDVNQAFDVEVIFPDDDIEYMQHYDPEIRPSVIKWPQGNYRLPIAWETIEKAYTSDNGRGPGGYFTVPVAVWGPMGGQYFGWAPTYDDYSFFNWDPDNPNFVLPEVTFILTDAGGRKVIRKVWCWVNVMPICDTC
jgi:hypothetical protein